MRWLTTEIVLAIHGELIAEHGGPDELRDEAALESAMARPRQKAAYGSPDLAALAAAYGFGLCRNHPFLDGNKRVTLAAIDVFLRLNGARLTATELDAAATILALAAGEIDEAQLAAWIRERSASL